MKRKFLYQQITDDLKDRIVNKQYQDGEMLESNSLLMKRYNASKLTVNKALELLSHEGYITRIPGTGSIVQYKTNEAVDHAYTPKMIGTLVDDIAQSDMWANVLKAIEEFLFPLHYQLLFGSNIGDADRVLAYIDQYYRQGVQGIVFVPISTASEQEYHAVNSRITAHMENYGIHYIIMHNALKMSSTVQVCFDNYADACVLTEAILQAGCTMPLLLCPKHFNSTIDERKRGFIDTLSKFGMPNPNKAVICLPYKENLDFIGTLHSIFSDHSNADALIGIDEYFLDMLHKSAQSDNCCINSEVLISGFGRIDERIPTNIIHVYQHQNSAMLGNIAIQNLLTRLNQPDPQANHIIRVPSELVINESARFPVDKETP